MESSSSQQPQSGQRQAKVYNGQYSRVKKINEGSFGKIILCKDLSHLSNGTTTSEEYCVLKKFKTSRDQKTTDILSIKEIEMMEKLSHNNVLKFSSVFKLKKSYGRGDALGQEFEQVFIRLPYFLEMSETPREELSSEALKVLVKQLLQAVAFLHESRVIHRDLKPSNIFLDSAGKLIVGDLGISRDFPHSKGDEMTKNIVTRLYRAPEILFGSKHYDESIDSWSLGCTIAEFCLPQKEYFFFGKSEIDQLCKVFEMRGSANEQNWPGCGELPYYMDFGDLQAKPLAEILPQAPKECLEIIDSLLQLDPSKRAKPRDILKSSSWLQSSEEEGLRELKVFAGRHIKATLEKHLAQSQQKKN